MRMARRMSDPEANAQEARGGIGNTANGGRKRRRGRRKSRRGSEARKMMCLKSRELNMSKSREGVF